MDSAVRFVLFGVIAGRSAAHQVARLSEPSAGIGTAYAMHLPCSILGYIWSFSSYSSCSTSIWAHCLSAAP